MSHMEEERSGGSGIDLSKISLRRLETSNIDDFRVSVSDLKMPRLCTWEAYDNKEKGLDYNKNIDTKHTWFKAICLDNRPVGVISATLNLGNDWCRDELGHKMNLIIRNVPLLAEVSIAGYTKCDFLDVAFTQVESCCSQLQILKLLKYIPYNKYRVFPIFPSLKQLEICVADKDYWRLHQLTSFIEASPRLHKLVLFLEHSSFAVERKIFKRAGCSHRCLKVAEMLGYYGRRGDARLVKYLTKAAVNWRKLVLVLSRVFITLTQTRNGKNWKVIVQGRIVLRKS